MLFKSLENSKNLYKSSLIINLTISWILSKLFNLRGFKREPDLFYKYEISSSERRRSSIGIYRMNARIL